MDRALIALLLGLLAFVAPVQPATAARAATVSAAAVSPDEAPIGMQAPDVARDRARRRRDLEPARGSTRRAWSRRLLLERWSVPTEPWWSPQRRRGPPLATA